MADAPARRLAIGLLLLVTSLVTTAGWGGAQEATPPAGEPVVAHHPAHLHHGSCVQPDPTPAYALTEIAMDMGAMGGGPAIPVEVSTTTVDAKLSDLLAGPYAIDVHEVRELATAEQGPIACGDLGGQPTGDTLAIGVHEENGSGLSGIAVLQAAGDRTIVTLYVAHGLSGAMHDEMTPAADVATVAFHVPTTTCPACPARVGASVRKEPGVQSVRFDGQDVTVTNDPSQVTPAQIEAAIEAGGDTVEPQGA